MGYLIGTGQTDVVDTWSAHTALELAAIVADQRRILEARAADPATARPSTKRGLNGEAPAHARAHWHQRRIAEASARPNAHHFAAVSDSSEWVAPHLTPPTANNTDPSPKRPRAHSPTDTHSTAGIGYKADNSGTRPA